MFGSVAVVSNRQAHDYQLRTRWLETAVTRQCLTLYKSIYLKILGQAISRLFLGKICFITHSIKPASTQLPNFSIAQNPQISVA